MGVLFLSCVGGEVEMVKLFWMFCDVCNSDVISGGFGDMLEIILWGDFMIIEVIFDWLFVECLMDLFCVLVFVVCSFCFEIFFGDECFIVLVSCLLLIKGKKGFCGFLESKEEVML